MGAQSCTTASDLACIIVESTVLLDYICTYLSIIAHN